MILGWVPSAALATAEVGSGGLAVLGVGALVERRVGRARLFVNLENLGNVRQTRYDPLVTAARGIGGRWTTDVWTELTGRTINGGVRLEM